MHFCSLISLTIPDSPTLHCFWEVILYEPLFANDFHVWTICLIDKWLVKFMILPCSFENFTFPDCCSLETFTFLDCCSFEIFTLLDCCQKRMVCELPFDKSVCILGPLLNLSLFCISTLLTYIWVLSSKKLFGI